MFGNDYNTGTALVFETSFTLSISQKPMRSQIPEEMIETVDVFNVGTGRNTVLELIETFEEVNNLNSIINRRQKTRRY